MIDDMTSSNESRNGNLGYACLACHARTGISDSLDEEIDRESRQGFLRSRIEARRGDRARPYSRLSAGYVIEEAAKRHFQLMEVTIQSLRGKFDEVDFQFLLNANCSPVWRLNHFFDLSVCFVSLRGSYASTPEEIKEEDEALRTLAEKLRALSPTEQLAVIEACERVWRGYENPLL